MSSPTSRELIYWYASIAIPIASTRASVLSGLWTHGLYCGLRFGLDFELMFSSMMTTSNNKRCDARDFDKVLLQATRSWPAKVLVSCRAEYFPWKVGEGCDQMHLLKNKLSSMLAVILSPSPLLKGALRLIMC